MKNYLKKLGIISLSFLLFWAVERACHHATDGFALVNIYSPYQEFYKQKSIISLSIQQELDPLFSQIFTYLTCGSQSYVFVSEDGKTVLKLFKFQHMRIPPWLDVIPLPKKLDEYRQNKKEKKRAIYNQTMQSFTLALEHFKEETGLLFVHLQQTSNLSKKIAILDKVRKKHYIHLDNIPFILQKRVALTYSAIDAWMQKGDIDKAKRGIHNLLDLACKRCKKGIFDKDPDFKTNFGFIGETPMQIDFGRFSAKMEEKIPEVYFLEMVRITRPFEKWIQENHPSLLTFFQKELLLLKEER